MTEHERDGGLKAEGRRQLGCGGGEAEGCKQRRGDSAGGLRGRNEPKGFVGWSSAGGRNAAERNAEGDLRGGDDREEGDGGKGGGRTERMEARGWSFEIQISKCHALLNEDHKGPCRTTGRWMRGAGERGVWTGGGGGPQRQRHGRPYQAGRARRRP
jgi:hypothetical protein